MKPNVTIFINYLIISLMFLEFFTRNKEYVDFGFIGILLIIIETFIIIFFLFIREKKLYQNILFIGSLVFGSLYFNLIS